MWVLDKALYGLRGAPKYWQGHLQEFLKARGFVPADGDSSVYILKDMDVVRMMVVAHVDDLLLAGTAADRAWLLAELEKEFSLKHKEHLDKAGDCAGFLGKESVKVEDGFKVRTSLA